MIAQWCFRLCAIARRFKELLLQFFLWERISLFWSDVNNKSRDSVDQLASSHQLHTQASSVFISVILFDDFLFSFRMRDKRRKELSRKYAKLHQSRSHWWFNRLFNSSSVHFIAMDTVLSYDFKPRALSRNFVFTNVMTLKGHTINVSDQPRSNSPQNAPHCDVI